MKLLKISIIDTNIQSISYKDKEGVITSITSTKKSASPRLLDAFADLAATLAGYYEVADIISILRASDLSITHKEDQIDKVAMRYIGCPALGERAYSFGSILRSWLNPEDIALIELVQSLAIDLCKPYGDQIPLLPLPLIEAKREREMCLIGGEA